MTKTGKDTVVLIGNHYIVIYNFRKELIQSLIRQGYRVVVLLPCTDCLLYTSPSPRDRG